MSEKQISIKNSENCFCFIADGIGGGPSGDYASQFILQQIADQLSPGIIYADKQLTDTFSSINRLLINSGMKNEALFGCGTTLLGLMMTKSSFKVISAGDSPAYLFRNNAMIKITEDQVLDPLEDNSPITSYFGGKTDELHLNLNTVLKEVRTNDIFLLCSDGLLKALKLKQIKAVLSNARPINVKNRFFLQKALEYGAEDNLSCILIKVNQ